MATVYVSIGTVGKRAGNGIVEAFIGDRIRSETITSSGTSASGVLLAQGTQVAQVYCATAVYARQGGTASATNGVYCPANIPTYITLEDGQAVSVIDA